LSILTPSGFGVREGALVFALSKIMSASVAGFVSLFGRFILILAEVMYVFFHTPGIKQKIRHLPNSKKWIGEHKQITILFRSGYYLHHLFYDCFFSAL